MPRGDLCKRLPTADDQLLAMDADEMPRDRPMCDGRVGARTRAQLKQTYDECARTPARRNP